jgi:hypothetical protein
MRMHASRPQPAGSRVARVALLALLSAMMPAWLCASSLAADEQVMLLPSIARALENGKVEIGIDAWVHEIEERPGLTEAFARYLDLDLDALAPAQRKLFRQRTQLFRVDSERRKDLRVRFADGSQHTLPRTGSDGRSRTRIATALPAGNDGTWVSFEIVVPQGDARHFTGRALLVPAEGISVVSDIDDTIKQSQVRDTRALLLNTFARPFEAVPGMAARYRELAGQAGTTRFHYVSSSPLQLYPPIAAFLDDAGFPSGSVHLRGTTSFRAALGQATESRAHKLSTIRGLLADFPRRRFILVGDSGEHDPEIYADLARANPHQVLAIGIRDVSGEDRDAPRYATTFAGIDADVWDVFTEPAGWQRLPSDPGRRLSPRNRP